MSSEQMRHLYGKILAGEIHRPASYSIKTIKLMAQLDNQAAALFRRFCSLSISSGIPKSFILDARVVSMGSAGANSLQSFGLSFSNLNILEEYGLIISDFNSYSDYQMSVVHNEHIGMPFLFQQNEWALIPKTPPIDRTEFRIHGVSLTKSGLELLPIVDIEPSEKYTEALIQFFDKQGYVMAQMPTNQPINRNEK